MYNHAPKDYKCPFCRIVNGIEDEFVKSKQSDIVYKTSNITALIASDWMINNPGHVVVITNKHYENIYDIPDDILSEANIVAKKIALAMKESYKCEGISTLQHNEKEGNQYVWHFHIHVSPRYKDDNLYLNHGKMIPSNPEDRLDYAKKLSKYLN